MQQHCTVPPGVRSFALLNQFILKLDKEQQQRCNACALSYLPVRTGVYTSSIPRTRIVCVHSHHRWRNRTGWPVYIADWRPNGVSGWCCGTAAAGNQRRADRRLSTNARRPPRGWKGGVSAGEKKKLSPGSTHPGFRPSWNGTSSLVET